MSTRVIAPSQRHAALEAPADRSPHPVEEPDVGLVADLVLRRGDVARDGVLQLAEHVDRLLVATSALQERVDLLRDRAERTRDGPDRTGDLEALGGQRPAHGL